MVWQANIYSSVISGLWDVTSGVFYARYLHSAVV